jgi:hypothetical protein
MVSDRLAIRSVLPVIVLLSVLAWDRLRGPEMRRPLVYDELFTIEHYTWAGVKPSGEGRRIDRVQDFHDLPRPVPRQLAIGIYRGLGLWKEPNNHVVNSLLLNFSLGSGRPSEAAARLPALVGALVFSVSLYLACYFLWGWKTSAPMAALWGFFCPYLVNYSQTARGYSWMVALQVLLLIALSNHRRHTASILSNGVCVLISVLTFMNTISMAVDWLLPVYLAAWVFPPDGPEGCDIRRADRSLWRKSLAAQILCIGAIGLLFLVDRLPYVYSAMRQYGTPITGWSSFLSTVIGLSCYLFPSWPWQAFFIAGIAGVVGLFASGKYQFLGAAAVATLIVSMAHFVISGKFPYERTCGFYVPIVILGAAYLVELVTRIATSRLPKSLIWPLLALGTLGLAVASVALPLDPIVDDHRIRALENMANKMNRDLGAPTFAVLPPISDYALNKYLPADWLDDESVLGYNGPVTLCLFAEWRDGWRLKMQQGHDQSPVWRPVVWTPAAESPRIEGFKLIAFKAHAAEFSKSTRAGRAWVVWQPGRDQRGIADEHLMAFLGESRLPYVRRMGKVNCKIDYIYNTLSIQFVSGSDSESQRIAEVVESGIRRFGGTAVVLGLADGP